MHIEKKTLHVTLKATNNTTLSAWTGSMLRGAIKNAIAYKYCKSLRYGNCNTCKYGDCPNKLLFDRKEVGCRRIQANLLSIHSPFNNGAVISDEIEFDIDFYGETDEPIRLIVEILTSGIYMGEPRVRWEAKSFSESVSKIDLPNFEASDKRGSHKITILTPVVSKHVNENMDARKFMQLCTLRITGIVNSMNLGYMTPYNEIFDDTNDICIKNMQLESSYINRKSSVKNRIDHVCSKLGSFEIEGRTEGILPFIKIASELGIGKECTMGLGQFSIE